MDWGDVQPPTGVSGIVVSNITVPTSCCAETKVEILANLDEVHQCTKLYANGCMPRLYYLVYQSAGLLGAGALTIAFIQVRYFLYTPLCAPLIRRFHLIHVSHFDMIWSIKISYLHFGKSV